MNRFQMLKFMAGCLAVAENGGDEEIERRISENMIDWRTLVSVGSRHLALPAFYSSMRDNLFGMLPFELQFFLSDIHHWNRTRNCSILRQLLEIAMELNNIGVVPLVLKGVAFLIMRLYFSVGDRVVSDLDILVPGKALYDSVRALKRIGYLCQGEEAAFNPGEMKHYPPLFREEEPVRVEIHVSPVRSDYSGLLPAARMWREAAHRSFYESKIALPSHDCLVLHNIIHAQLEHNYTSMGIIPFRHLYDLFLLSIRFKSGIDLDFVKRMALISRDDDGSRVRLYLHMCSRLFGNGIDPLPDCASRLNLFFPCAVPEDHLSRDGLRVAFRWIRVIFFTRFRFLVMIRNLVIRT